MPANNQELLHVYAIAARVTCQYPEQFLEVSERLERCCQALVPPERATADECARLWLLFTRAFHFSKPALQSDVGKAFFREIENLSQRLDLPPLPEWDKMPVELVSAKATKEPMKPDVVAIGWRSLEQVQQEAQAIVVRLSQGAAFPADQTARLLSILVEEERSRLLDQMVGRGMLGRSDVALIARCLARSAGTELNSEDTSLVEVLERLGRWLSQSE